MGDIPYNKPKKMNNTSNSYYVGDLDKYKNRSGIGTLYNISDDTVIYRGQWIGGKAYGCGNLYNNGRLVYSGGWMCGKRHGFGEAFYEEEGPLHRLYSGGWKDGQFAGDGIMYYPGERIMYDGKFENNLPYGKEGMYFDSHGERKYNN